MRFLTPAVFLTLTSTLTVSALPYSQFSTRTDDLTSRDGLEERAVDAKSQAMADKIEKSIMMEEWGHNKRAVDAKSQAMADKIEKSIMMEEWGHNKRSPKTKKLSAAELAQADAEEDEEEEENAKRAVAVDAKSQAMADKIEKSIMMEEWGHNKRSPKTKKLSAAELAQADAEEDEEEEENAKRALSDLFAKKPTAPATDATADAPAGGNNALAASISAAIAEDEAPGLATRSPKTKKLTAAELAQADAEEDEEEEENAKRALAEKEDCEEMEMEKRALSDFIGKKPVAATNGDATAATGGDNALAASISAAIAEDEAPGLQQRATKVKKLSAAELAQADAEEDEEEEDN